MNGFFPAHVATFALQSGEATISKGSWPDTEPVVSGGFGSQAIERQWRRRPLAPAPPRETGAARVIPTRDAHGTPAPSVYATINPTASPGFPARI